MDILAKATALVGAAMVALRRRESPSVQAMGSSPAIPQARAQGIMTLKMPTARGWAPGHVPTAAPGLKVNAFASGLQHPRWIEVLPNGDVLVAEALQSDRKPRSLMDHAMIATMRRAKAVGISANRVSLWRDKDGDGVAEHRHAPKSSYIPGFGTNTQARRGMDDHAGTVPLCTIFPSHAIPVFDDTISIVKCKGHGASFRTCKVMGHTKGAVSI